jgi:citrate synthase
VTTIQPIRTRIWHEEPEPDDAFATRSARCHGFDVAADMLGRAKWAEMLFLLFRGEPPDAALQTRVLDALALVLANPGPRDPAVHAAMCAGVGGSPAAASLMAALAVGAGESGGAREVHRAMELWAGCGTELGRWREALQVPIGRQGIWPGAAHPAGFEPHSRRTSTLVLQWLEGLVAMTQAHPGSFPALYWLAGQREAVESLAGAPVAATGVAAATLFDLGFTPDQGEMLHLLLRLPGAAAHALEQRELGHKNFPFFAVELQDDPEETPA